jgi:hypothetical protein
MKLRIAFLAILLAGFLPMLSQAQVYISNGSNVQEYDPTTGDLINSLTDPFGGSVVSLTEYNGILYTAGVDSADANVTLGSYDAASLSPLAATQDLAPTLPSGPGIDTSSPAGVAADANYVYVDNAQFNTSDIIQVNLTTGAVVNNFITLSGDEDQGLVLSADGSILYTTTFQSGEIQEYNAITGALINANFASIGGAADAGEGITIDGNTLYVADESSGSVSVYNATTGAMINSNFLNENNFDQNLAALDGVLYVTTNSGIEAFNDSTAAFIADVAPVGTNFLGGLFASDPAITPPGQHGDPIEEVPGSAPEPRTWALALMVCAGFLFLHRKLQSVELS